MNRHQQGFNLISLMIGTTLSLISIMAMLTLYKNLVSNAAIATQDARQDGQVASARLTLQRELQSAGYGMTPAVNTDLVLLKSATLSTNTLSGQQIMLPSNERGNAVLWRYEAGGGAVCRGILSTGGSLFTLATSACNGSLTSRSWVSTPLIATSAAGLNDLASFSNAVDGTAFSLEYEDCWPYQKDERPLAAHLTATLTTNLTNSTAGSVTYSDANQIAVCLPNFPRP